MPPPDDDWNRIGAQLARVTPSPETSATLPPAPSVLWVTKITSLFPPAAA